MSAIRDQPQDLEDSQNRFCQWREMYNCIRPHEALGMQPPITRWRPSERAYEPNPQPLEYLSSDVVRKVDISGRISFQGRSFRVGRTFSKERVGLRASEADDGVMNVIFAEHQIGQLDLRDKNEAMCCCCAGTSVATLPKVPHSSSTESVTHVSEQV